MRHLIEDGDNNKFILQQIVEPDIVNAFTVILEKYASEGELIFDVLSILRKMIGTDPPIELESQTIGRLCLLAKFIYRVPHRKLPLRYIIAVECLSDIYLGTLMNPILLETALIHVRENDICSQVNQNMMNNLRYYIDNPMSLETREALSRSIQSHSRLLLRCNVLGVGWNQVNRKETLKNTFADASHLLLFQYNTIHSVQIACAVIEAMIRISAPIEWCWLPAGAEARLLDCLHIHREKKSLLRVVIVINLLFQANGDVTKGLLNGGVIASLLYVLSERQPAKGSELEEEIIRALEFLATSKVDYIRNSFRETFGPSLSSQMFSPRAAESLLQSMHTLCADNDQELIRVSVTLAGIVPIVVRALEDNSRDPQVVAAACRMIAALAADCPDRAEVCLREDALIAISIAFPAHCRHREVVEQACDALTHLAVRLNDNRIGRISFRKVIIALATALQSFGSSPLVVVKACAALSGLLRCTTNEYVTTIQEGGIPSLLVTLLGSLLEGPRAVVGSICEAIECLAYTADATEGIKESLIAAGVVPLLVKALRQDSSDEEEACARVKAVEAAMGAISALITSAIGADSLRADSFVTHGGVPAFINVLIGTLPGRESTSARACALFAQLSYARDDEAIKRREELRGEVAIRALLIALHSHSYSSSVVVEAMKAIEFLSSGEEIVVRMIHSEGAVSTIMSVLLHHIADKTIVEAVCGAALSLLSCQHAGGISVKETFVEEGFIFAVEMARRYHHGDVHVERMLTLMVEIVAADKDMSPMICAVLTHSGL